MEWEWDLKSVLSEIFVVKLSTAVSWDSCFGPEPLLLLLWGSRGKWHQPPGAGKRIQWNHSKYLRQCPAQRRGLRKHWGHCCCPDFCCCYFWGICCCCCWYVDKKEFFTKVWKHFVSWLVNRVKQNVQKPIYVQWLKLKFYSSSRF